MKKQTLDPEKEKTWALNAFRRKIRRKKLLLARRKKKEKTPYHSEIIEKFASNTISLPKPVASTITVNVPKVFSLIDNPQESLQTILTFASEYKKRRAKKLVTFNHRAVQRIDLTAESILGFLAAEIKKENAHKKKRIGSDGYYPDDIHLQRIIRSVGVVSSLNVKSEELTDEEVGKIRIFKKRGKRAPSQVFGHADYKEKTIVQFVNHIDQCLADHNRRLKIDAKKILSDYTGEILTNAEDHSGTYDWTIIGYLDNIADTHICEITIFNLGKTIAETLRDVPKDSFVFKEIYPYIELHRKSGFFRSEWNEDDLLTLVALQGHISCKNITADKHRGLGTVDLIEFFQAVYEVCAPSQKSCASMAILSGNTHILFDGKYKMRPDYSGRKVIAFNDSNDLRQKPDAKYVSNLGNFRFPGTIIGIKFPLEISEQTEEVSV